MIRLLFIFTKNMDPIVLFLRLVLDLLLLNIMIWFCQFLLLLNQKLQNSYQCLVEPQLISHHHRWKTIFKLQVQSEILDLDRNDTNELHTLDYIILDMEFLPLHCEPVIYQIIYFIILEKIVI